MKLKLTIFFEKFMPGKGTGRGFRILAPIAAAAVLLTGVAGCGGGGGDGGAGNQNISAAAGFTAVTLQAPGDATFSVAVGINGNEVVGLSDGQSAPASMRAVAWLVDPSGGSLSGTVVQLAMPAGAGQYSAAYGNNRGGAIVGEIEETPGGTIRAAYWQNRNALSGDIVLLGQGAATRSAAYSINTSGWIAGELILNGAAAAATWSGPLAQPAVLPAVAGQIASSAYSINDAGTIVGELADADGTHAAVWRPNASGVYTSVLLLPRSAALTGDGIALSINSSGVVVGELATGTGQVHAVKWTPGEGDLYTLSDLGIAGADSSTTGVNDSGRAVGYSRPVGGDTSTALTWIESTATPLTSTAAGSQAYAVNASNWIVGIFGNQAFVAVLQ